MPAEFSTEYRSTGGKIFSNQPHGLPWTCLIFSRGGCCSVCYRRCTYCRRLHRRSLLPDRSCSLAGLGESIKPVLTINKLDRFFLELQLCVEDAYQACQYSIVDINVVMAMYQTGFLSDFQVYPDKGTTTFSTGLDGWGSVLQILQECII